MTDTPTGQAVAVAPQPKTQISTGASVAAMVPKTLDEMFRLSQAIAISGLAPSNLSTPEKIMVSIMAGAELGMPPFQSLQSFAVINNRPTLWGDGMLAVVLANGFGVKEWFEGEDDAYPDTMTAHCEVTRPDNGDVKSAKFSVADAKKAGLWGKSGPWSTNPKRMLKMRARAFGCRDGAADTLRGFQMREEVEDYEVISPAGAPSGVLDRLQARVAQIESQPGFRADVVETGLGAAVAVEEPAATDTPPEPETPASEAVSEPQTVVEPEPADDAAVFEDVAPAETPKGVQTYRDMLTIAGDWPAVRTAVAVLGKDPCWASMSVAERFCLHDEAWSKINNIASAPDDLPKPKADHMAFLLWMAGYADADEIERTFCDLTASAVWGTLQQPGKNGVIAAKNARKAMLKDEGQ